MKSSLLAALMLTSLLSSPAFATDKTITLTDIEQQQLLALLDLAVKSGGLKAAAAAAPIVAKLTLPDEKPASGSEQH